MFIFLPLITMHIKGTLDFFRSSRKKNSDNTRYHSKVTYGIALVQGAICRIRRRTAAGLWPLVMCSTYPELSVGYQVPVPEHWSCGSHGVSRRRWGQLWAGGDRPPSPPAPAPSAASASQNSVACASAVRWNAASAGGPGNVGPETHREQWTIWTEYFKLFSRSY